MKNIYEVVAYNLKKYGKKRGNEMSAPPAKLKTEDSELIRVHTARPFDAVYVGDYWVVYMKEKQLEVMPAKEGKESTYLRCEIYFSSREYSLKPMRSTTY